MDFSKEAFRPSTTTTVSNDTMDHARMVMACRFGWAAGPENGLQGSTTPQSFPISTPLSTSTNNNRTNRFTPCRGRLYHQLNCSHRIRTDVVEDCGFNCLDPLTEVAGTAFYCQECFEQEASTILNQREVQHNASYPSLDQMTKEQYEQWYNEHRQLEAQFMKDRKVYELELKSNTRPSNICSALELSQEETAFAAELDLLSLAMVASNDSTADPIQSRAQRVSLPNDESEQLHWHLNSLALDRGACGVEYAASQSSPHSSMRQAMDEEELWRSPRK